MSDLTGQDIERLVQALDNALSFSDLEGYVLGSTGDDIYSAYVGRHEPKQPTIRAVLKGLEQNGLTPKFLHYVYVRREGKPKLRQLIEALSPEALSFAPDRPIALSAQTAGKEQSEAPSDALAPGFQRNVRPTLPPLDVRIWMDAVLDIERRLCRVERGDAGIGTGFLVGPDTVLTNWHVVESAVKAGTLGSMGCRFDFIRLPDGKLTPGKLIAIRDDGCIVSSRYSGGEGVDKPDDPLPSAQELDFALLRLTSAVGDEQPGGRRRGWVVLPSVAQPLPANAPLLILQHPQGGPMKMAMDTQAVIGRNGNATRIRYHTNTEKGSSGSPCFTMNWDIVALHHYGDPLWKNPKYNQGVPIELIRAFIEQAGHGSALGI